jgi:hypothetical protein
MTRDEIEKAVEERTTRLATRPQPEPLIRWFGPEPPERLYAPEVIEATAAAIADPNNPAYQRPHLRPADFFSRESYEEWERRFAAAQAAGLGVLPPVVVPDLEEIPIDERVMAASSIAGDDAADEEAMRQWEAENPIELKVFKGE